MQGYDDGYEDEYDESYEAYEEDYSSQSKRWASHSTKSGKRLLSAAAAAVATCGNTVKQPWNEINSLKPTQLHKSGVELCVTLRKHWPEKQICIDRN